MSRIAAESLAGPLLGTGVSASSGGGSGTEWTPGAWVEWNAALEEDIYLAACACHYTGTPDLLGIEIAIGASGAESVVVAQAYGAQMGSTYSTGEPTHAFDLPTFVAAGSRVAVRIRLWRNAPLAFTAVQLCWYPATLTSDFRSRAVGIMLPDTTAGGTFTAAAPAWTWSAWQEVSATGLAAGGAVASLGWMDGPTGLFEVEIGAGAAGSEVALTRWRAPQGSSWATHSLRAPAPIPVPPETRLAVRLRTAGTSGVLQFAVNAYGPEPETEVWVPVANYVEQEIAGESFPGGAARVLGELWTEALGSPGPVVKARLYNLTDSVSVGESAEIQSDEPADCDFAVTLSSGTKRYRLEVTSEPAGVDLFFSGRGVGP